MCKIGVVKLTSASSLMLILCSPINVPKKPMCACFDQIGGMLFATCECVQCYCIRLYKFTIVALRTTCRSAIPLWFSECRRSQTSRIRPVLVWGIHLSGRNQTVKIIKTNKYVLDFDFMIGFYVQVCLRTSLKCFCQLLTSKIAIKCYRHHFE